MGTFLENLGEGAATQGASAVLGTGLGLLLQGSQDRRQIRQQQKLTDMQTAANKEMGKFNYEQQMQMWHDTNYGPQMEELKKAGLNPALIYGTGGPGGTTAAAPAQGASGGQASGHQGEIMGMMQMGLQAAMQNAQIENIKADTANKIAENPNIGKTGTQIDANTTLIQTQTKKVEDEIALLDNDYEISQATKESKILQTKTEAINEIIKGTLMKSNIKVNDAQIAKMSADIAQRQQEINIKEFEAEIRANYPSIGDVLGSMVNSMKIGIDNIIGLKPTYTKPNQVKK